MLYQLVRPMLFSRYKKDPEVAHELALSFLEGLGEMSGSYPSVERFFRVESPKLEQTIMGIKFPNPVGLAAGFSKNGKGARGLIVLGFGFLELGTVTP